jgi:hypothetical protein
VAEAAEIEDPSETPEPTLRRWSLPRKQSRTWGAWVGSKEDLQRIGALINDLAQPCLASELKLVRKKHTGYMIDHWSDEATVKWTPEATAPHEPHEGMAGPPNEVINALDPKTVTRFGIKIGKRRYSDEAALSFNMAPEDGVTLQLESSEVGWLAEASERMTREIQRCVPWWALLRTKKALWACDAMIVAATGAPFAVNAVRTNDPVAVLACFYGVWLAVVYNWIVRKTIPAFEVVPVGVVPKGRRVVGVAGLLILNAVVVVGGVVATALLAGHTGSH